MKLASLFKMEILEGNFFCGCWRIHQIHQNIPPIKFCAIRYFFKFQYSDSFVFGVCLNVIYDEIAIVKITMSVAF